MALSRYEAVIPRVVVGVADQRVEHDAAEQVFLVGARVGRVPLEFVGELQV